MLPRSAPNCCDCRRRDGAGNALHAQDRSRAFQRAFDCPRRLKVEGEAAVCCVCELLFRSSRLSALTGFWSSWLCSHCVSTDLYAQAASHLLCKARTWFLGGTNEWSRRLGGVPCFGSLVWDGVWNLVSFLKLVSFVRLVFLMLLN